MSQRSKRKIIFQVKPDFWMRIVLVAAGGAVGALCRYGISLLAARLYGSGFAWGTLAVNLAGCLLIGFFFALAESRGIPGPWARIWVMTGFLGALTTFSTYALESIQFFRAGEFFVGVTNLAVNNLGGLVLVLTGMWLGSRI